MPPPVGAGFLSAQEMRGRLSPLQLKGRLVFTPLSALCQCAVLHPLNNNYISFSQQQLFQKLGPIDVCIFTHSEGLKRTLFSKTLHVLPILDGK